MKILLRRRIITKFLFITLSLFFIYLFMFSVWTPEYAVVYEDSAQSNNAEQKLRTLFQLKSEDNSWEGYFKRTIQGLDPSKRKPVPHPAATTTDSLRNSSSTDGNVHENEKWNFTVPYSPHPFALIKNPIDACQSRHIFLLNVVHSKPSNFKRRNLIRKTWGDKSIGARIETLTIFFTGKTNDSETEAGLQAESDRYHDIVQEDYVDSYMNLTYKAVSIFRWITDFCPNAEFVLKTDDDVFVNTFDVIRTIRRHSLREPNNTKIMCRMAMGIVHREPESKWYMTEKDYPYARYPPFCKGFAFIMPGLIVPRMYRASLVTKFFWVDDAYSTGMVAYVANVSHTNLVNKFIYSSNDPRKDLIYGEGAVTHIEGGPNATLAVEHWEDILKMEQNALR